MESTFKFSDIKPLLVKAHPITKLFLLLFGMLAIFLIINFLGMLLAIPFFGFSWSEISELIQDNLSTAGAYFIKYFQGIQSIGFFVIPGLLFYYLLFDNKNPVNNRPISTNSLISGIILVSLIASVPLINYLVYMNSEIKLPVELAGLENTLQKLENDAAQLTEKILSGKSFCDYLLNLIIIALLPSIGEEFIFRGVLQRLFLQWTKSGFLAICLAGIIFSAFHLQFYGFIPRLLLGIYFGYLFYWSKKIWFAVWAHFLNNAMAVSLYFLSSHGIDFFPGFFGEETQALSSVVFGTILSLLLVFLTWNMMQQKKPKDYL
jgi:membrane protease YdiL (CAAX protease family)